MTVSSLNQLQLFLIGALTGAVCGAAGCFLSAVRSRYGAGGAIAALTDLAFWLFAAAALIWTGLRFNSGEIRAYQIFAAVCGCVLYGLCFGKITAKLSELVLKAVGIVLSPAAFLMRGFCLYVKSIAAKINKMRIKIGKNLSRRKTASTMRKKIRKNYKKML